MMPIQNVYYMTVWVDRKKAEFAVTNKHRPFTHMHILSFMY